MHRLVAVHELAVAQRHLPRRLVSVHSAVVVELVEDLALPRSAIALRHAAALDYLQQAIAHRRIDAPALQPLVGDRQQPPEHELYYRDLPQARPIHARVESPARPGV